MKPLIGITINFDTRFDLGRNAPLGSPGSHSEYLSADYNYAIERAGGIPVLLARTLDVSTLHTLIDHLDGVLVTGGNDLNPALWGERLKGCSGRVIPERDDYDLEVIRYAYSCGKPILGICRGMQALNVAFGGSLYQDLESDGLPAHQITQGPRELAVHSVTFTEPGSILHSVFSEKTGVNSYHHQAVKEAKPPVRVTAVSEDGVVEGIEVSGGNPFVVGVQWHPEKMFTSDIQLSLFCAFIKACRPDAGK